MTEAVVVGWDATHADLGSVPPSGQAAGYSTGSPDIAWTASDWARFPGAVRIDQDPGARDPTADVLDVEAGAATPAETAAWCRAALADYNAGARPGQRSPAIYCSLDTLPSVLADLRAAGVAGIGFVLAEWSLSLAQATALVTWGQAGAGPYPVVGIQYADAGAYDLDVWSAAWLASGPLQDTISMTLPQLAAGAQDPVGGMLMVHRVQVLCAGIGAWNDLGAVTQVAADGIFGPATAAAVAAIQGFFGITVDSTVGPVTWHHLMAGC
jgi:peptidoglycan hydrolase-like protein with peptidoglycan-binding domain